MATLLEIPMQSPIERNFPDEVNVLRAFGIDVPAKFDDVCTIYRASGFLYPQKSESLEPFWPSIRPRMLTSAKAIHNTPVPWIAIVSAMSDRPQIQFCIGSIPPNRPTSTRWPAF